MTNPSCSAVVWPVQILHQSTPKVRASECLFLFPGRSARAQLLAPFLHPAVVGLVAHQAGASARLPFWQHAGTTIAQLERGSVEDQPQQFAITDALRLVAL